MNDVRGLPTRFAPAERALPDELGHQVQLFSAGSTPRILLDSVPNVVMVLNKNRQMVYCNRLLLQLLGVPDGCRLYGLRPGELLNCIHSDETESGCGTTEFCSQCGAVRAILASQQGRPTVSECRILRKPDQSPQALDLRVWATPLEYEGELFTIFAVNDIEDEKRRLALERIFFHDLLNSAAVVLGATELIPAADAESLSEAATLAQQAARRIVEEIEAQKNLLAAENNELDVQLDAVRSLAFLQNVARTFAVHPVASGRLIRVADAAEDITFISDAALLGRVIGNMVKNALEASAPGETVTLGCRAAGDKVQFWVHNPGVIPREAQLQIFQRSFSTKGPGRGLGTYSMKLLSELYLHGSVYFESTPAEGTRFVAEYPSGYTRI